MLFFFLRQLAVWCSVHVKIRELSQSHPDAVIQLGYLEEETVSDQRLIQTGKLVYRHLAEDYEILREIRKSVVCFMDAFPS